MSISSLTRCPTSQTSSSRRAFPAMATSSARASATSWRTSPLRVTPPTTAACFGCRGPACAPPSSPDRQSPNPEGLDLPSTWRGTPGPGSPCDHGWAIAQRAGSSAGSAAERPLAEGVEVDLRAIEHRKAAVDALKGKKQVGAAKQDKLRTAIMVQSLAGVEEGLPLRAAHATDACHLGIVPVHLSQGLAVRHDHRCRGDRPIKAGLHNHARAKDPNGFELPAPDFRGNERNRIQKWQR